MRPLPRLAASRLSGVGPGPVQPPIRAGRQRRTVGAGTADRGTLRHPFAVRIPANLGHVGPRRLDHQPSVLDVRSWSTWAGFVTWAATDGPVPSVVRSSGRPSECSRTLTARQSLTRSSRRIRGAIFILVDHKVTIPVKKYTESIATVDISGADIANVWVPAFKTANPADSASGRASIFWPLNRISSTVQESTGVVRSGAGQLTRWPKWLIVHKNEDARVPRPTRCRWRILDEATAR